MKTFIRLFFPLLLIGWNSVYENEQSVFFTRNFFAGITTDYGRLECNNEEKEFAPTSFYFHIFLHNYSDKELLFFAQSYYEFRGLKNSSDSTFALGGDFYLVNNSDSLRLISREIPELVNPGDTLFAVCWLGNEEMQNEPFSDFLCQFPSEESSYKKAIFQYLRESQIVYVPYVEDYKKLISEVSYYRDEDIIYSTEPLVLDNSNLLFILYSHDFGDGEWKNNPIYYEDTLSFRKVLTEYKDDQWID